MNSLFPAMPGQSLGHGRVPPENAQRLGNGPEPSPVTVVVVPHPADRVGDLVQQRLDPLVRGQVSAHRDPMRRPKANRSSRQPTGRQADLARAQLIGLRHRRPPLLEIQQGSPLRLVLIVIPEELDLTLATERHLGFFDRLTFEPTGRLIDPKEKKQTDDEEDRDGAHRGLLTVRVLDDETVGQRAEK